MTEKWINAFIDVGVEHIDFIDYQFKKHNIHEYIISHETEPRDHYHLVGFTTRKNWDNTMKTFLDKFDLRTKRAKGVVGGKVKYATDNRVVNNIERLKSYVLKQSKGDMSTVRSQNIDADALMKYYENSYEKTKKKKLHEQVFEDIEKQSNFPKFENYMNDNFESTGNNGFKIINYLRLIIINYLRIKTDVNMCRSNINSYTQYFIKHTEHYDENAKDKLIYALLF